MANGFTDALWRILRDVARSLLPRQTRRTSRPTRSKQPRRPSAPPSMSRRYPGDYTGVPPMSYDPHPGKIADPGEVVWTWVPFEEDHSQGKDRPVLIIGRDGDWLLGLMLTSKDHDRDAAQERRDGRRWVDIGSGSWDPQWRPSEVRVNRVIRVDPGAIRRVCDRLHKDKFDKVAAAVRRHN
ncbi:MAG: type II toxin-antitoxin system PemK/MazF family toxin [Propionibacteriaceae bacterium]|nr:type II toxin-antitoxin system PemK/MazF family toxin [Propionibacteriaceae bacterium]